MPTTLNVIISIRSRSSGGASPSTRYCMEKMKVWSCDMSASSTSGPPSG